jgi:cation diffusion facilitator CzcD-associated flavoprotein CzcO
LFLANVFQQIKQNTTLTMAKARLDNLSKHLQVPQIESYDAIEEPLGTTRKVRVVLIGAGASGINMLRALRLHLAHGSWTATAYEKNPRVGGTWFENRYPGCRCDIPAHNYQFAWKPNTSWSSFFAPAEEIEKYLEDAWEEEKILNVAGNVRLECKVISAVWKEAESIWSIVVEDLKTKETIEDSADFLLNGSGILK